MAVRVLATPPPSVGPSAVLTSCTAGTMAHGAHRGCVQGGRSALQATSTKVGIPAGQLRTKYMQLGMHSVLSQLEPDTSVL